MKRQTVLIIVLAAFAVVCLGLKKSRVSPLRIVQLTSPRLAGPVSLEQALAKRRSVREFTGQSLTFEQIGQLAWAGQGITEPRRGLRTAPSAGALYPIDLYFVTKEGVFVYNPDRHNLEEVIKGDSRDRLSAAALNQEAVANAACDIIVAGSARKLAVKYGNKARRYMLLEAGHVAQNIQLQAVCLGLGSVTIGAFDIRDVSKVCKLTTGLEPLYIICVGYPAGQGALKRGEQEKKARRTDSTKAKRAALIIASRNFRDEEIFETKRELEAAGIETVTASTKTGVLRGMLGGRADAAILVSELNVDDYDAIIFVGGSGAKEYFNNPFALNIAREAKNKGKVLAAICIAPTVLANAGVLNGVRATSFPSEQLRLIQAGARYTGTDVERDGLVITGSGPKAATQFGKVVAETIVSK